MQFLILWFRNKLTVIKGSFCTGCSNLEDKKVKIRILMKNKFVLVPQHYRGDLPEPMYRLTLCCPQKHSSVKCNILIIWQGNDTRKNILIKCVSMSNSLQGYCNLQLSFTMNLPCKFELSLISLLPYLPELLRFTSLFNLLVGPDPPFCKLIIQVNVCYFHRNYDVVEVL